MKRVLSLLLLLLLLLPQGGLVAGQDALDTAGDQAVDPQAGFFRDIAWDELRHQLGAVLLVRPDPLFAPCHPGEHSYNQAKCSAITAQAENASFIAQHPTATDNNDFGCLPDPKARCLRWDYPAAVVNASTAEHVSIALRWATKHNVAVNVKATGHDYVDRSRNNGLLSIWTRHLAGIELHESFKPPGCPSCVAETAITVGAGVQAGDLLAFADKHGRVAVTGLSPSIGIVGHSLGGGHSSLTRFYGLAADQILAVELVLPDGTILTVSHAQREDLFWALAGNGASTFGVVTKLTLRTFEKRRWAGISLNVRFTGSSDETFWEGAGVFHSLIPNMSDAALSGYYYLIPQVSLPPSPDGIKPKGVIAASFGMLDGDKASVEAALEPFHRYARSKPNEILWHTNTTEYDSWYAWWQVRASSKAAVRADGRATGQLASRLLSREALSAPPKVLGSKMKRAAAEWLMGVMVGVKGTMAAAHRLPPGGNSVNPGWRTAYTLVIVGTQWKPDEDIEARKRAYEELYLNRTRPLVELEPFAASYLNEGNPCEPDWRRLFYGDNYARLLAIKKRTDPRNLFTAFPLPGGNQGDFGKHDFDRFSCPSLSRIHA